MSLETKEFYVGTTARKEEELKIRQNFGWYFIEDIHRGKSHSFLILLGRDPHMRNYNKIVSLEDEYDCCKKNLKTYSKIVEEPEDLLIVILLFILFIFPLVIYCYFKSNQKMQIEENNARLHKRMKEILEEARELL